ncbi:T9SS type A sorting domain-containing protein, partial [Psychroflexus tropicus]|uniref:T9SS type A sorting domain-containing protein n=1 Tax=Psychroflexus tropicus TaxID=197345 RepID=UPI000477A200
GTCPNSSDVSVTINALDDASFSYAENEYSVESDDPTPTITGLSGGTFTSAAGLVIDASSGIIDVSVSAPGTYTVFYTTNGACSNTANFEITILDCTLSASAVATNVTCASDTDGSIELTVTGGTLPYTFAWNNSATTEDVSGLPVGNYEVTVTDARNCSVIVSIEVEAVDNVDPVISCLSDQTITLTSGETTYTVPDFVGNGDVTATDNCDGNVASITQNPAPGSSLSQGEYDFTFIATDLAGNTDECTVKITVEETLGLDDLSLNTLSIYPNPVGNLLSIELPDYVELEDMTIYDLTGKEVMNINLNRNQKQIDVSNLQSAQYLVSIRSKNGAKVIRRLLKK